MPILVGEGHHVTGTSRTASGAAAVEALGATGMTMDALDQGRVSEVVYEVQPEVVIHQLTAIGAVNLKHLDEAFAATNRLRTEGLDHLLRAAIDAGARRVIAQSFTGWTNSRVDGPVTTEEDPLDPDPAPGSAETLRAISHLESAVTGAGPIEGIALRYGTFYGPGTGFGPGGEMLAAVQARKLPVVGGGGGVWSFVHVRDAARATAQAVERGRPGVYNVVDDEPAPVAEWLPHLARVIGAKPPRRVPIWLARPLVGELGVRFMTEIRGADNAKAKRQLHWQLEHPTWRDGFRTLLP